MHVPLTLVFLFFLACAAVSLYWIFYAVPADLCSMTRYKLWHLRDDLVDDLTAGRLPHSPDSQKWITAIEVAIEWAHVLTPFTVATGFWAVWDTETLARAKGEQVDAQPRVPTPLDPYQTRFIMIMFRHLLFASPSGWFCLALYYAAVQPVAKVAGRARGLQGLVADIRRGIGDLAVAGPFASQRSSENLSSCM